MSKVYIATEDTQSKIKDLVDDLKTSVQTLKAGVLPHITLHAQTGSTVTIYHGDTSYAPEEESGGTWEQDVDFFGMWSVRVVSGGETMFGSVKVKELTCYELTAVPTTLKVSATSGASVSVTFGGEVVNTHTGTGSAVDVAIGFTGDYVVSATDGVDTRTKTVHVTADGGTVGVNVKFPTNVLNDNDWDLIADISAAGTGDTYWDVGDCKEVTLNGTVGTKVYNNVTLYVFILDFNHPNNKNEAENNIVWQGFKTAATGGTDVALDDAQYGTNVETGALNFNMNHWGNSNFGGWVSCDLRYDILGGVNTPPTGYGAKRVAANVGGADADGTEFTNPKENTLMAALPADLRAAMALWDRWLDSAGNSSNVEANVTKCVDALTLLAEFEEHGARTYANEYEKNHQKQMAYYANGNSKVKYKQSSTTSAANHWGSSAYSGNAAAFCLVNTNGYANGSTAYASYAVAPAFKTGARRAAS